ncbi:hypothetical protein [Pseudomonas indica]|uniref:hypothetical protein n=1 Tax=Pseudomonas indica TaxID=137658 RepID=UPI003FD3DA63
MNSSGIAMRLRLILFLILTIAFPAYASLPAGEPPCPMLEMDMTAADATDDNPCCQEDGKGSQLMSCKSGQECKTGGTLRSAFPRGAVIQAATRPLALPDPAAIPPEPGSVWRPPRFL